MSRNRISMSGELFGRLAAYAIQGGVPIVNQDAARWIKKKDDADSALMTAASAVPRIVTRQIRLVRIEHDEELYFCTFGLPDPEQLPPELELVDATPGIFAVAILKANVHPLVTIKPIEVKQVLDGQFMDNGSDYQGHDLEEVMRFFPNIVTYRATNIMQYHNCMDRVIGSILARTYLDGPIELESETIDALTVLFETSCDLIPFRNLVQGILSISWENLFLECYRCIEQLYGMERFLALKAELNFASSPRELAKLIEYKLSWRPKENEAFVALVRLCDQSLVRRICKDLGIRGRDYDKLSGKLSEKVYGLRNNIVHYRPSHNVVQKTESEWNAIIRAMIDLISELYSRHADQYFECV